MGNRLKRFIVKARAGTSYTPKRKHDILHVEDGKSIC
jgi:hypothetical protein